MSDLQNNLVKITGGEISTDFANTVFVPPTMTLGQNDVPVTQAEIAFILQASAIFLQSKINVFTSALLKHRHENGQKFVHDHSAFRTFYTQGEEDTHAIEKILGSDDTDAEKIASLTPLLEKEPAIARKFQILSDLGYAPVQVLDLRKNLNLASFLFTHKGDASMGILPQNIPAMFVSFIFAERELGDTPEIIKKYTSQEQDPLTENDYTNLETLAKDGTLTLKQANQTVRNLAHSQTRLWPILSSSEYDSIIASEEKKGKTLNVAAEVIVVGYLLNHATERPQDLSGKPEDAEQAWNTQNEMADIIGEQHMNPMSFKAGDEEKVGERNLQGNTKSYNADVTFSDGETRKVSHGFVEWAGWQPQRDESGVPVLHSQTQQVILAPVFDAGRTGKVFEKQKSLEGNRISDSPKDS